MVEEEIDFKEVSKNISFLVNTAVATVKIKKLTVMENNGAYNMRPTLHLILSAPVGQLKSTILQQIADTFKREVITEVTRAGLVGSLDNQTFQMIAGAGWESRNSLLLLDEFTFGRKKEGWEVFLQLLESQRWGKRIGVFSADQSELDGDLYFKVSKGRIDLKTRFACIVATMKNFKMQSAQSFRAFVTRTSPYPFNLTEGDLEKVAQGKKVFEYQELNPPEEVIIDNKVYRRLIKHVKKGLSKCDKPYIRKELFLRSVGDLCRVYAVWGKNDNDFMNNIIDWKVKVQQSIGSYFYGTDKMKDKVNKETGKVE
jgi:hypothetical protein